MFFVVAMQCGACSALCCNASRLQMVACCIRTCLVRIRVVRVRLNFNASGLLLAFIAMH